MNNMQGVKGCLPVLRGANAYLAAAVISFSFYGTFFKNRAWSSPLVGHQVFRTDEQRAACTPHFFRQHRGFFCKRMSTEWMVRLA